jgi:hypothetical protein
MYNDDEWGNIELPGLSDKELFHPRIEKKLQNKSKKQRQIVSESNKKQYAEGKRQLPDGLTFKGRNHNNSNKQAMSHKGKKNGMYGVRLTGEQNHMFGKEHSEEVKIRLTQVALSRAKDQKCPHCKQLFTKQAFGRYHGNNCKLKK